MGGIAEQLADRVVVTDDNPRSEEPQAIVADILSGLLDAGHALAIHGRAEAVTSAIMQAKEEDVVLVAGKGHEDYQEISGKKYPMDERVIIKDIMSSDF